MTIESLKCCRKPKKTFQLAKLEGLSCFIYGISFPAASYRMSWHLLFNPKTCVMKIKTKQDKLEKHKRTFFLIGLVIALGAVLTAFEWTTYEYSLKDLTRTSVGFMDEDMAKITVHKKEKIVPPKPKITTVIKEVENDANVKDVEIFNPEDTPSDSVPEFVYTPPEEEDGVVEDVPFRVVEDPPEYPGGEAALMQYLISSVRYTQMAKEANIQGTIYVSFVIEKDGSVSNVRLLRGLGAGLDEIALEAVHNMLKWSPGKQRGIPVRVEMSVPFKFKLQ